MCGPEPMLRTPWCQRSNLQRKPQELKSSPDELLYVLYKYDSDVDGGGDLDTVGEMYFQQIQR